MKNHIISLSVIVLMLSSPVFRLQAQSPQQSSVTGHVTAEVITAFSAVETSQMNFGRFSPGPYGGKIIITPQGTISVIGSVVQVSSIHNPGSYYISGDDQASFSINLPLIPTILTNTVNAKTMVISGWLSSPLSGTASGILHEGYATVFVGATLEVGTIEANPVGIYTGTYVITFDFN
jgi:hypothetical protein